MGVTDLTDAGTMPLAVTDMMFSEIGLVHMNVADEVNVTPRECGDGYSSCHGPALTDICGIAERFLLRLVALLS